MTQSCNSPSPILASRLEHWPLNRLTVYERNPRVHSAAQIEQIGASIEALGYNNPLLINPSGGIIVGAGRYYASRERNIDPVPVIVLEHLSEAQQSAYRIADNQLALNASWNEEALALELALAEEAMTVDLLGFTQEELKRLTARLKLQVGRTDEDAVPETPQVTVSRLGDLWRLGPHLVLCADATVAENISQVLAGAQAAMTFMDLPYNVSYGQSHGRRPIENDDLGEGFEAFLRDACRNALAATSGAVYICMSSSELHTLQRAFLATGGHYSTFLIWAKDHFTLGRSDYQHAYEPILYGWRQGTKRYWCGARDQGDVWFFPKPKVNDLHPTMKPVALIERAISNSSREQELVLDPFGGSGSTLIACQKTGRLARLVEIDPLYVDVIVRRWQEFSGGEAILEADGRSFAQTAEARVPAPPAEEHG